MHDTVDTHMKKQKLYLIAGFTAAAPGVVMLFFGFLTGRREILYAGAGLVCLAAAVPSVLFLRQSLTNTGAPVPGSERSDTPGSRVLYADHLVSINGDSITFHSYSFPHKASRRVAFTDINHLMVLEPSLTNGRWRIWGSGDLCTWFPLDVHRSSRDRIFIATLKTRGMNIGFTVEDSSRVLSIFKEHGLIGGEPGKESLPGKGSP